LIPGFDGAVSLGELAQGPWRSAGRTRAYSYSALNRPPPYPSAPDRIQARQRAPARPGRRDPRRKDAYPVRRGDTSIRPFLGGVIGCRGRAAYDRGGSVPGSYRDAYRAMILTDANSKLEGC